METTALTNLPETRNTDSKSESNVARGSGLEPCDTDSQLNNTEVLVKLDQPNVSTSVSDVVKTGISYNELLLAKDSNQSSSISQAAVKLSETLSVAENSKCLSSGTQTEHECLTVANVSPIGKRKRDGENEICDSSTSSVKKVRMTINEDKPTVYVKYGSLTRESKQKLEELLQQWSAWHTQHCSPTHDFHEVLESGEGTYFPALRVGVDNSSAVTFWMNNPLRDQLNKASTSVDCKTAPLYDRGYSLEGDPKKLDAFRCFNCGSYSHSLQECEKPRDNVAINNARTQHQSNHIQKSSSFRMPTRYYQNSPAGKYDGLVPGVLQAETRRLLGLGELDPPQWLNRMRDLGYPPGYLDSEVDEDQPSGITIFADEEKMEETETSGKAHETDSPRPPRKMSVKFPGINAQIPKNADERKWSKPAPSFDFPRTGPFPIPTCLSQPTGVSPLNNQRWHTNNLVPPGCDPGLFVPAPFSFSPMYASHNSDVYQSPSNLSAFPILGSPTFRGSPLAYNGSLHSTSPSTPYMRPRHDGHFSPGDYGRFGYERRY